MTGPEHYAAAENAITDAAQATYRGDVDEATMKLQVAQVHATLALAAASAQNIRRNGALAGDTHEVAGWAAVLES